MGLKSKIANRLLNSKLNSLAREKKVFNLDSARTAGILWEIEEQEAFEIVQNELKKAGIETVGLCYSHSKKVVLPQEIKGFTRKHSNWSEIPKTELVEDFIQEKFDLLIDLTGQKYFQLQYVNALSVASFKIGYSGKAINYFDLNIEFQEEPEPKKLAEQILYYLKRINKTTIE